MATTECKTIDIVKQGLDFIISHFKAPIWPRTISTSATNGAQVLELDAQGHSIMEIAKILHISHGTVDNDLLYLRKNTRGISESCSWNKQGSKDMLEYHK